MFEKTRMQSFKTRDKIKKKYFGNCKEKGFYFIYY